MKMRLMLLLKFWLSKFKVFHGESRQERQLLFDKSQHQIKEIIFNALIIIVQSKGNHQVYKKFTFSASRCLKITQKVSFNIASEASYVYICNVIWWKMPKLKNWNETIFVIFKHREFEDRSCRGPRHLPLSWIFCSNYLSPVSNALEQSPWTNECIFFFLFQRALKQWLLHFFLSARSLAVCQLLLFSRRREKHLIFWSKIVQRKLNELFLWKKEGGNSLW